ncbi:MAG: diguanylate cyclase domain-containing protein [Candidatus Xenobia bacterium]
MRVRILVATFLTVVVLLVALAGLSTLLLHRVLDRHLLGQVETERLTLRRLIEEQMTAEPPQPGSTPETPQQRALDAARQMVEIYRIGGRGYAWLASGDGKVLAIRADAGALSPLEVEDDRRELAQVLAGHPKDGAEVVRQGPVRYVAWTPLPEAGDVYVGVTYPQSEVAPLLKAYEMDVWLVCLWLSVLGLVASNLIAGLVRVRPALMVEEKRDPGLQRIVESLEAWHRDRASKRDLDVHAVTGLPSRNALSAELFRRIDSGQKFAVGLADGTNFTPYNTRYGYERGDRLLRFLAGLIVEKVREHGNPEDFVAHLEADHFVFVTTPEKVEAICQGIVGDFDKHIGGFYSAEERERGSILSKDRKGDVQLLPLMRMTIGVATNLHIPLIHPLQIAHICGEVREYLKQQNNSVWLLDRRRDERTEEPVATAGVERASDEPVETPIKERNGNA